MSEPLIRELIKRIELLEKNRYRVGDILLSMTNINPSNVYGGSWNLIAQGKTLVGVDTSQIEFSVANKAGGEKTHKLTIQEMPSHQHRTAIDFGGNESLDNYGAYGYNNTSRYYNSTSNTGDNQPHNNLPPYLTCYIWQRIS